MLTCVCAELCQPLIMCPGKYMYDKWECVGRWGKGVRTAGSCSNKILSCEQRTGERATGGQVLLPSLAPGLSQVHNSCFDYE